MAEKEKNNELENMSFEDAINELEKIVDELEAVSYTHLTLPTKA